jgi:hypothetical protein
VRAAAHMASLALPIGWVTLGVIGLGTWALVPTDPKSMGFAAVGLVAVLIGASRLRGVAEAKRLLDGWEGSPGDFQAKPDSH